MLRARRYRVLLVFTVIFCLVIFHFTRSRNWDTTPTDEIPVDPPKPHRPPTADSNAAPQSPHGFASEGRPPQGLDKPPIPDTNPDPQNQVSGDGKPVDGEPAPSGRPKPNPSESDQVAPPQPSQAKPENLDLESGIGGEGRVEAGGPVSDGQSAPHWKKLPEHFPLDADKLIKLPTGKSKSLPKLQARFKDESVSDKMSRLQKLATIKEAFEHAWTGYKSSAMGHDELEPLRGGFRDPFNGWGATLVDALDTLWIMDLKKEFSIAVDEVKKIDFTTSAREDIPLFETTIRYLGGLLGAYDISGHKYTVLLDKAMELADMLIGAFDTPNRMPMLYYQWAPKSVSQPHLADAKAVLAEIGSLSIEFTRLAQLSRDDKYYDAIARITNELEKSQDFTKLPGLWPLKLDASGCRKSMKSTPVSDGSAHKKSPETPTSSQHANKAAPTDIESYKIFIGRRDITGLSENAEPADYDQILGGSAGVDDGLSVSDKNCKEGLISAGRGSHTFGLGALADSTYEYMPKEYMLLGGVNEQYRKMYEKAMDTTRKYLLFQPMVKDKRDLRFASTVTLKKPLAEEGPEYWTHEYEGTHLACFAGGMFGVGAKLFGIDGDLDIAAKLTDGCVWAYESTTTGIMPESFELLPCEKGEPCVWNETRYGEALDPQEEQRILQAQKVYEQRVQFAKEAEIKAGQGNKAVPTPPPGTPPHERQGEIDQREAEPPVDVPTPTASSDLAARDVSMPEKPMVLSHDEFVQARVREERMPPGFVNIDGRKYLLRPEAIESVFLMYRLTGDNYWREKGWKMFEAISKHTRTELANSAIHDVTAQTPRYRAEMESFWLAETLKYFYLLFSDPSVVSLDDYVLNTEAHPLRRPQY